MAIIKLLKQRSGPCKQLVKTWFYKLYYKNLHLDCYNNIKITLILLAPMSLIKSLLLPYFFAEQWFNNGNSINVALNPRI